jgi:hypothetical protein
MQTIKSTIADTLPALNDLSQHAAFKDRPEFIRARDTLSHFGERLGRDLKEKGVGAVASDLGQAVDTLIDTVRTSPEVVQARDTLLRSLDTLKRQVHAITFSLEIPSRRLLGFLPVARVIPQDVHSVCDYSFAMAAGIAGLFGKGLAPKLAGAALYSSATLVSLLTDYRLSIAKLIPIEAHEVIDFAWCGMTIAAPFALGYWKKAPATAITHVVLGSTYTLISLFTDYRAARGVGRHTTVNG